MLITQGGRFGGYGFYVVKNKPVFLWNLVDLKRVRWEGPDADARQTHARVRLQVRRTGRGTMAFGSYAGSDRAAPAC